MSKKPLSITEQITKLESKGLIINDKLLAENFLNKINYYRFGFYCYRYIDKLTGKFKNYIKFEDIVAYFEFDYQLRIILFDAIARFELIIKSHWINLFCINHNPNFGNEHYNQNLFKNSNKHNDFLIKIQNIITYQNENYLKNYIQKHGNKPDLWVIMQELNLSDFSKMIANYKGDNNIDILQNFKLILGDIRIKHYVISNWIKNITILRNYCAHHAIIADCNNFDCLYPHNNHILSSVIPQAGQNYNKIKQPLYHVILILLWFLKSLDNEHHKFILNQLDEIFNKNNNCNFVIGYQNIFPLSKLI